MLSKIARSSRSVAPLHLRTITQRGFRPAVLPSIESEVRKDSRRKISGLNTNSLDAEAVPVVEEPTKVPRRMASSYPSAQTSRASVTKAVGPPTGILPGSNTENTGRGHLEDFLFGSETNQAQSLGDSSAQNPTQATVSSQLLPSSETDYVIDPITNRKVYKVETPTALGDALATPAIKSQFSGVESTPKSDPSPLVYSPVFDPEFPITQQELQGYAQPRMDSDPTGSDGRRSGNVYWHHANGVTTKGYLNMSNSEKYDDLSKYKPVMEKAPITPKDPTEEYQDLEQYQPVMTGRTPVTENPSAEYEDLDKYKPVLVERTPVAEDPSKEYTDLDQYTPVPDVKQTPNPHEKEVYKDLPGYSAAHPDVETSPNPYEKEAYLDLHLYAMAFPDVDVAPNPYEKEVYTDLHLYQGGFAYCEPDGKPLAPNPCEKEAYSDLDTYYAFRYNEPDGKPTEANQMEKEKYTDLEHYSQGYRASEPDGRYALRDTNVKMSESDLDRETKALNIGYTEPGSEGPISKVARAVSNMFVNNTPQVYERSWGLTRDGNLSNCKDFKIISSPKLNRGPQLTGSKEEADEYGYTLKPLGLETSYADECNGRSTWPTFTRIYGIPDGVPPPASDAAKSRDLFNAMPSASSPQPSSTTSSAAPSSDSNPTCSSVCTTYKVLAYDPTTQTVEMAQTTSTVSDNTTGLPPSEALVRLAHPTKFFPYFAPLQDQGFEIVSGSGDLLVFRKSRQTTLVEEVPFTQTPRVNPIDMTGASTVSSAATAFLSPTGFSRYEPDPDPINDQRPPPPRRFQPGIGQGATTVHTAEHFSSTWSETNKSTKSSRHITKKIIVGASSALGIAYAVAVVGEFFKSNDGRGPKRL
ncbi:hypothetical protein PpBr36_07788 [Pyricularia pennisetigena]|uniref:hypothetical protein n=1 Tax=Pyricularia pennisetigena TaxID=1578925 RepID=UPI001150E2BD|nr:hypothetical protein PpBr36_07788 [Pyricularia pennisetigena]TLS24958.1 hypothetical protein PpBr36_07788 [Pyricularia pennisetigena]